MAASLLLEPTTIAMPLQSTPARQGKGLRLLSLDAGGTRGVSQLKILSELMHRLNFEASEDQKLLPCEVFDMIGGSGSGGFIAILFVVLGLSTEQAMNRFVELSVNILEKQEIDAPSRTAALKAHVEALLGEYHIEKNMRLLDSNTRSRGCKLVVPISYERHVGPTSMLRNFNVRQEETLNSTIVEAMLATLAGPPLFTSTSILKNSSTFNYIGADVTLSNPTRQLIAEAHGRFGDDTRITCLLNIGSGHPGIIKSPASPHGTDWIPFLEKLVTESEQKAEEIKSQMGHLGIYHRFSVTQGLERETILPEPEAGDTIAHTAAYLTGFDVSRKIDICVELLKPRESITSPEQFEEPGGQTVLPPVLPQLTKNFVMRREPWNFIEEAMLGSKGSSDAEEPRMLVMTGMGGCGKTQLILKFIHVHRDKFKAIFFIDGSSALRIRTDTIRHVRSLGIAHSQKGFEDCLLLLSQPLAGMPRLILYDNVDDPKIDLTPLLPLGGSCAIVIVSRNRSLGEISPETHLELDIMSLEEAVDLLLQRSGRPATITDHTHEEAAAICRELGFLPIPLTQARSYMYQTQCSSREYLTRLLSSRDKLLSQPVKHHPDMRYLSTYAAFDASFGLLSTNCQHLLRLLSFVHWSDFPLELVILASKHNFSEYRIRYTEQVQGDEFHTGKAILTTTFLHEGQWDITRLDEMIVSLRNHSLVTLIPGIGTQLIQMHPITHGWVKSCIPEHSKANYQAGAILLLSLGSQAYYTPCAQYMTSHIAHLASHWDGLHVNTAEAFAHVLYMGGSYEAALQLRERVGNDLRGRVDPNSIEAAISIGLLAVSFSSVGRYKDAEQLQLQSLKIYKERLGARHPDTIVISSSLALTYRVQGQLKEAKELQEEALMLRTEILGEGHPDTVLSASQLAATYRLLGRLEDAQRLVEEVLKMRKIVLGDHHPDTVTASSSLALIYRGLGRLKEAESLQKEVLRRRKDLLGRQHPDTITASLNLALMQYDLAHLQEAELLQQEALGVMKEIFGDHHPDTVTASSNLALTYRALGRLIEAESLQKEVLRLRKGLLGERHPDTIMASSDLAVTYCGLARLKEAEPLQEEVWALMKETLGDHHPYTITASSNLALTYRGLGRLKEAESLQKDVLGLRRKILGQHHPETLVASSNLALTYTGMGRLKEAEQLQEEVLGLREKILGRRHPHTITAAGNLAITYSSQGQLRKAEQIQKDVLRLSKEILGERHPDTATASANLALTYRNLGQLVKSRTIQEEVLKLRKEVLGAHHLDTLTTSNYLAELYLALRRLQEAENLHVETLRQAEEALGSNHHLTTRSMLTMAEIYELLDRKADAFKLVNVVEPIIAENCEKGGYQNRRCQQIKTRLQAGLDDQIPVAALSPLLDQLTINSPPSS